MPTEETKSLLRLLNSTDEKNIDLALTIFEGKVHPGEVLEKIIKDPALVLRCLQAEHQSILAQCRFIYLRRKSLREIPENVHLFSRILMLDFGYNHIQELPEGLFSLKKLKKLRLHYNRIQALPENIHQLEQLEELVLDANPLKTLPQSLISMRTLKKLSLKEVPWPAEEKERLRRSLPQTTLLFS